MRTVFRTWQIVLVGVLVFSLLLSPTRSVQAAPEEFDDLDLVISEYVEGSGADKAIEIFNPSPYPVDLSEYSLQVYFNGSAEPQEVSLAGSLLYGDTYVVVDDGSSQPLLDLADLVWSAMDYDGNDSVVLKHQDEVIDSIGQLNVDPGPAWPVWDFPGLKFNGSTKDTTLQKYQWVCRIGDRDPTDPFFPIVIWHIATLDDFSDLGTFACDTEHPPVAENQAVTTSEDVAVNIILSGDWVTADDVFQVSTVPQRGTLSGTAPNLVYTPHLNQNGPDYFEFVIVDGATDTESERAVVTLNVESVDDQPVADAQTVQGNEDSSMAITLTGSDVETAGNALVFNIVDGPTQGTITGTEPNLTYTPVTDYYGPDSFTFTVNDGNLTSEPATVTIDVLSVNDLPIADSTSVVVDEDDTVVITLTGSDVETTSENLVFAVGDEPSHGVLTGTAPNLTYQPDENFNGADSFTFTVDDGENISEPATISITVNSVNDNPVAVSDSGSEYAVAADQILTIAAPGILTNDSDVDGDPLEAVLADDVSHGTLTLNPDGSFTYDPDDDYVGLDTFTYKASDGDLESDMVTVTILVTAIPVTSGMIIYLPFIVR